MTTTIIEVDDLTKMPTPGWYINLKMMLDVEAIREIERCLGHAPGEVYRFSQVAVGTVLWAVPRAGRNGQP